MQNMYLILSVLLIAGPVLMQCGAVPFQPKPGVTKKGGKQHNYVVEDLIFTLETTHPDYYGPETNIHIANYNDTASTFVGKIIIRTPVSIDIILGGELFKKSKTNNWVSVGRVPPVNLCDMMEKNEQEFVALLEKTTIPTKCPVPAGVYEVTETGPVSQFVPSNLPVGKYLLKLEFRSGKVVTISGTSTFTLDEALEDYEE